MSTFMFVGAGASQTSLYPKELRLPSANELKYALLRAHYGNQPENELVTKFHDEFSILEPTADQVWQNLIRKPTGLEHYTEELFSLFRSAKPIPPTYYLLARWFFVRNVNVSGFATTNFDLQLPKAFHKVAQSLNINIEKDYAFAEVPQDFKYLVEANFPIPKVICRLHGSLNKPWSIVAGAKDNVNALSNLLYDVELTKPSQVFGLIREFLDIADPTRSAIPSTSFPPYDFLQKGLGVANRTIVIGYSFQDAELRKAIFSSFDENRELVIVDPSLKIEDFSEFPRRTKFIKATAEDFLQQYVSLLDREERLIMLPKDEKDVLRVGPRNVPGYPPARITTSSDDTTFLDPVYGPVRFSERICSNIIEVIDTGELQRLRQIKQLSFAHYKHHGATHDRFSHSLGVALLADRLACSNSHFPRLKTDSNLHLAFTIAALIHDIGHGPFGHTMDLVRRELGDTEGHEDDTGRIYEQIFSSENSFADLDMALDDIAVSRKLLKNILKCNEAVGLLINNEGCDIDRLDYVMRDASLTVSSISGGNDEARRDLQTLVSGYHKILSGIAVKTDKGKSQICYHLDCEGPLRAFGRLYQLLYNEVYYGWQNTCARAMLTKAVVEMVQSRWVGFEDIKPLTDIELLALLEEFENPKVRELAHLVKYRRLYALVLDKEISVADEEYFFSLKDNKEMMEKFAPDINFSENFLFARLPSKKVVCQFAQEGEMACGGELFAIQLLDPEILAFAPARLQIFAPPKS